MFYQPTRQLATCAHLWPKLFPLTNKLYQLLLTAPATVASDERTFSQLKKRVLQENKARQIFWKTSISYPLICTRVRIRNLNFLSGKQLKISEINREIPPNTKQWHWDVIFHFVFFFSAILITFSHKYISFSHLMRLRYSIVFIKPKGWEREDWCFWLMFFFMLCNIWNI